MNAIFDIAELVAVTLQISSKLYEDTLKSQSTTIDKFTFSEEG